MTDPIIKTTGFHATIAQAIGNDGVIEQQEAVRILDAVRGQGGIAPRELAQARILKERLFEVVVSHGMWPKQVAAQKKFEAETRPLHKAAALLELTAVNLELRLLVAQSQKTVDGIYDVVEQGYGSQWGIHKWVLGVVFGGDANRPTPDAGLDANGRPLP